MGACHCNKNALMERNLETGIDNADNLVSGLDDLRQEQLKKVKSHKNDLLGKVRQMIRNFGDTVSEEDFNKIMPEDYYTYMVEHPFAIDNPNEAEDVVDVEPVKFQNGNYYWGQWNGNGVMSGEGKYYLTEDQVLVEGFWKNGIFQKGRIILPDGWYEGEIEDNLFNGNGKMIYRDGRIYDGEWVMGNKEGSGSLSWPDGSKYWGSFKNDQINGEGDFLWANGYKYKGEFVNGSFNGKGTLNNPNGSHYTGEFKDGLFHGEGKFIWIFDKADKSKKEKYCGHYVFGKREGMGKYTFANGDVYQGEWFDNQPHGQGQYETENKIYRTIWRNGQVVETPIVEVKEQGDPNEPNKEDLTFVSKIEDIDYKELKYLDNLTEEMRKIKIKGQNLKPTAALYDSLI